MKLSVVWRLNSFPLECPTKARCWLRTELGIPTRASRIAVFGSSRRQPEWFGQRTCEHISKPACRLRIGWFVLCTTVGTANRLIQGSRGISAEPLLVASHDGITQP